MHVKSVKIFDKGVVLFKEGNYSEALNMFLDSLRVLEKANINQPLKNNLIASVFIVMSQARAKMNEFDLAEQIWHMHYHYAQIMKVYISV